MARNGCLVIAVFTFAALRADGGNKAHGGDPLRLAYASAKIRAAAILEVLDLSEASNQAVLNSLLPPSLVGWLSQNKTLLKEDIEGSRHCRKDECGFSLDQDARDHLEEWCLYTTTNRQANIVLLDSDKCMAVAADPKLSTALLIHESTHHLGITDEAESDAIANAITALAEKVYRETPQSVSGTGLVPYSNTQAWKRFESGALFVDDYWKSTSTAAAGSALIRLTHQNDSEVIVNRFDSETGEISRTVLPISPELRKEGNGLIIPKAPVFAAGSLVIHWSGLARNFDATSQITSYYNHGYVFDTKAKSVRKMTEVNTPCAGYFQSIVATDNGFIVWGGGRETQATLPERLKSCDERDLTQTFLAEGRIYEAGTAEKNYTDERWITISREHAPPRGRYAAAVWTGKDGDYSNRFIVWGLRQDSTVLSEGGAYDLKTKQWTKLSNLNAPRLSRNQAAAVWTGTEMIVVGTSADGRLSGGRYDPKRDAWRALPEVMGQWKMTSAQWTGSKLLVWTEPIELLNLEVRGAFFDVAANQWEVVKPYPVQNCGLEKAFWIGSQFFIWNERHDLRNRDCTRLLVP